MKRRLLYTECSNTATSLKCAYSLNPSGFHQQVLAPACKELPYQGILGTAPSPDHVTYTYAKILGPSQQLSRSYQTYLLHLTITPQEVLVRFLTEIVSRLLNFSKLEHTVQIGLMSLNAGRGRVVLSCFNLNVSFIRPFLNNHLERILVY